MKKLLMPASFLVLQFALCSPLIADVWRWVDANGNTHFVDSEQAIYVWTDNQGKVFYSDKPDHEDAVRVQLFWHSKGTLADIAAVKSAAADDKANHGYAFPGETAEQRATREAVVAKNCERATQILKSYENAPQLYRTDEAGERIILDKAEYAATLMDAREKTKHLCSQ
jgi:hypothetical protein